MPLVATAKPAASSPLDRNVNVRHVLEHPVDDLLKVLLPHVLGDCLKTAPG